MPDSHFSVRLMPLAPNSLYVQVMSQKTRIQYCTAGILLRRLDSDGLLVGVTHVIVDEVICASQLRPSPWLLSIVSRNSPSSFSPPP